MTVGLLTQRSDAGLQNSFRAATANAGSVYVGGSVMQSQAAGDRIWVLTCIRACEASWSGADREQLVEVAASGTATIVRRLPLSDVSAFVIVGNGIWVAHFKSGDIERLNPATARVTARVRMRLRVPIVPGDRRFLPISLTASGGYLLVSSARGWIAEINTRTATLVRMVTTPSEDNQTATDRYGTWVAEDLDGFGVLAPHRLRLRIHIIMQAGLPLDVYSVISGGGVIWALAETNAYPSPDRLLVIEINPRTDRILRRKQFPPDSRGAVVVGGALYVGDLAQGSVYRISRDGTIARFATPRHDAALAAASAGVLWATTTAKPGRLLRISLPGA